ncbi:ATP-dependent nuclease [Bacillus cereus]|uniref:ATP-dependent nuclease n=1 Tax=Bacillus cereus TaxID=1396 RepID=UPI0018F6145A|nr:AAA family ATPase [Bacillus cereus]MBJ8152948.1 AAA family ATPase [Bacillus cereus]
MKLKGLYIRNFRNIKEFFVEDMKDVNLFIGKNNIGKSNYLRAVRCFFNALESRDLYREDILIREDIMSGTKGKDLALIGLLSDNNQSYIVCVGCINMVGQVYTYHYIMKNDFEDSYEEFVKSIHLYSEKLVEYGEFVKTFIIKIRDIKKWNIMVDERKKEYAYIASLTIDLKLEETMNAHKYIEENLELSASTIRLLKSQKINVESIKEDILHLLQMSVNRLTEKISDTLTELNSKDKDVLNAWRGVLRFTRPNRIYFYNENIRIPQVISGFKTMFQAEKKEIITSNDAQTLFSLKNKKEHADSWINFKNMCKKVLDIEIDVFLNSENVPIIDISNNWINLNGTGIREVFRIIVDIESRKPDIIFIEEPEIHLHFELQQRLSEYLHSKAEQAQIFITSHSTAFVEDANDKSVYLIKRREEKENSIQLLDSESLDEITRELGYNAQVLLIKKMLIFVEGKTDKAIIDTYLQKFYPHMLSKIGCIDMKGETKYKYFANAESLEIFEKSGVKTFFILDSDYKTQEEKDRKISQHPEKSSLVFWPGVCIENLFLNPVVLEKFITAKDETKKKELDEIDEIMKKTYADIKIDSSRKYIREKYLKAIYPEKSSKDSVDDTDGLKVWFNEKRTKMREALELEVDIDSIVEEFDVLWENKLDEVVPGDKFLIKFCENIGNLTYKKNEKNVRYLINDLSKEEWPTDFTRIMEEIIQKANNRVLESV